jgi:hypothetical protein
MFFAPNGKPITSPAAVSFNSPNIEINDDGTAGIGHFDDFPDFSHLDLPGLGNTLLDIDQNEWLESHCRLIEVDAEYDVWSDDEAPAWPREIEDACHRVQYLGQTLWCLKKLRDWSPKDITTDPTISGALKHLIEDRVQAEIAPLQARIAAYRTANPDITAWAGVDEEDPDDVPE